METRVAAAPRPATRNFGVETGDRARRYDEAARRLLEPAAPFPKDEWEQLMADAAATPEFDDMLNRARVDGLNLRRRLAEDVEPVDPELRRIVEERNAAREEGRLLLDPI